MREFLLFAIERNMISNKYGIEIFYTCFMEAAGEKEFLDKSKFYYAIFLLSKALYGHSENPFEEMYQKMLIDSNVNNKNDLIGGRLPKEGPHMYEILSINAIKVYLNYLDQLKHLFAKFIH
jgi:hypothetical protein